MGLFHPVYAKVRKQQAALLSAAVRQNYNVSEDGAVHRQIDAQLKDIAYVWDHNTLRIRNIVDSSSLEYEKHAKSLSMLREQNKQLSKMQDFLIGLKDRLVRNLGKAARRAA